MLGLTKLTPMRTSKLTGLVLLIGLSAIPGCKTSGFMAAQADWLSVPMYPDKGPVYNFDLPLECSYYPNSPCVVPAQPREESPVEREQRLYQDRQLQLKCANHPDDKECH